MGSIEEDGVRLEGIYRSYGKVPVLNGVDITVKRGSIYGLLGPSGCGKTTLLKVVLGGLQPDEGRVRVLGNRPDGREGVPGKRIGYSPQETALYQDLSIRETLQFHGKLHGMSNQELEERKSWLMEFLELPDEKKVVGKLSGGQQRRVSLAVALLHSPEVLILDEPTVGLDPLLRMRIWEHLRRIASTNVTIIITTHYIEEAGQADCVGLMRKGRILTEGNPSELMERFQKNTLEDVFLELCRETLSISTSALSSSRSEGSVQARNSRLSLETFPQISTPLLNAGENSPLLKRKRETRKKSSMGQIYAITRRKITQYLRNPFIVAFDVLIPTLEIFLFVMCIGTDPLNLPIYVLNADVGSPHIFNSNCTNLGNEFTNLLKQGPQLNILQGNDLNYAIQQVQNGQAWMTISIPQNFSSNFVSRALKPSQEVLNQTTITVHADLSNFEVASLITRKIQVSFDDTILKCFGIPASPIQLVQPAIYGSSEVKFSSFLAPGIISTMIYAHSIGLTSVSFVRERTEVTMDRIAAAGVSPATFIIAHFIAHSLTQVFQSASLIIFAVFVLGIQVMGSVANVAGILVLLGWSGMAGGLVISSITPRETEAMQMGMAVFFPALLLSGVLWPLEAVPSWMAWFSKSLPTTWASGALRSVMIRGWGIDHFHVWMGYLIPLAWFIGLMALATLLIYRSGKQSLWFRLTNRNKSRRDQH